MKEKKMGLSKRQKTAPLMPMEDPLMELPDGILSSIISLLSLKEAVKTSILSKRWQLIWTSHSDLCFDAVNVLGSGRRAEPHCVFNCQNEMDKKLQRNRFIKRVDQFMQQRCWGPKVNSFAIHFHLGKESTSHVDHWLSCAVMKAVENIDLNLSVWFRPEVDFSSSTALENYRFPCWLLAAPGKTCSTVKHLQLASCSLGASSCPNFLTSLVTLELRSVTINDEQVKTLLSNCLLLERLSLHLCNDLVNLNIAEPKARLKVLNIQNCLRLEKIEICAENLVLLEYTGFLIKFSLKCVPKLVEVFLNFTGESRIKGVTYALTRFASYLPQLETLNLLCVLGMKALKLPENVVAITNVRRLMLTVFPFDDEDELCWISYILKAFPLLQKLQLNLFSPSFIRKPREVERHFPKCPHKHVTEVEINGFYGNQHEAELLTYLLGNLVELKTLVIGPRQKVYKGGFNKWVYEEPSCSCYKLRAESVREWLKIVVPLTVHLEIC
ncbi:F-box/FBD/LRR-repeat protein At1g13570-like [Malania oleifera]|uniref:F-box/FBD/LRR-repeat protein At1g13570-like n=1 Tax=Malania oleifera TaxID=397392 RepID=UPI0025AEC13D|nr:F-box/FBD/LRR-repeat protein At1g13570-like [Malania oleifera]XP_057958922.1 F-box/FBD/LRR-repeat protein At1g13570-like [Malania oleifera]